MKKILILIGLLSLTLTFSNGSWWSFGSDSDKKEKTHKCQSGKCDSSDKKEHDNKCDSGKCGSEEKKDTSKKAEEKCGVGKCG